jgi:hypothetical protein
MSGRLESISSIAGHRSSLLSERGHCRCLWRFESTNYIDSRKGGETPLSQRKQDERGYVARTHYREMSTIDRCYLVDAEPFGNGDHRRVGAAQRQVTILAHQRRHPHQVTLQQIPKGECLAGTEGVQESRLRAWAKMSADEEARLSDHRRGHHQRSPSRRQPSHTRGVVSVPPISEGIQNASVDDDHRRVYRPNPSRRNSSARWDTSFRPLSPMPTKAGTGGRWPGSAYRSVARRSSSSTCSSGRRSTS